MSHLIKSSFALALSLGLALTAAAAPAAMARPAHNAGYAAQAFAPDSEGSVPISNHRAEALRECNAIANRYLQQTWGDQQGDVYRACMTEHGEAE